MANGGVCVRKEHARVENADDSGWRVVGSLDVYLAESAIRVTSQHHRRS